MVPQALAMAIEENVEFRKGLPLDYLNYMGIVHQDKVGCTLLLEPSIDGGVLLQKTSVLRMQQSHLLDLVQMVLCFSLFPQESSERQQFQKTVEGLVKSLVKYLPLDAACDQMGKQAIHDALPPVLTEREFSPLGWFTGLFQLVCLCVCVCVRCVCVCVSVIFQVALSL